MASLLLSLPQKFTLPLVVATALSSACRAPINRSSPPPEAPPPKTQFESADLKKRVFVLKFRDYATPPPALRDARVAQSLEPKVVAALGQEQSPFLPQSPQDEQAYGVADLNSDKDIESIVRSLRGSDIAGFLRGEVSRLDTVDSGGDVEGLLKTKTLKFTVGVHWELFDTTTGRKIASGDEDETYGETRSDLFGAQFVIPELGQKLSVMTDRLAAKIFARIVPFSEKLGWNGRVLRIDGARIYLNSGRRTGIVIGDTLKVIERPREIVDPQSGNFVGEAPGRIKGTLKVIQYFGTDGAVAVLQSGGGVFPGDRVQLF